MPPAFNRHAASRAPLEKFTWNPSQGLVLLASNPPRRKQEADWLRKPLCPKKFGKPQNANMTLCFVSFAFAADLKGKLLLSGFMHWKIQASVDSSHPTALRCPPLPLHIRGRVVPNFWSWYWRVKFGAGSWSPGTRTPVYIYVLCSLFI